MNLGGGSAPDETKQHQPDEEEKKEAEPDNANAQTDMEQQLRAKLGFGDQPTIGEVYHDDEDEYADDDDDEEGYEAQVIYD